MKAAGTFFLVLFILLIVGAVLWVVYSHLRAKRLGLPPPSWTSYIPFLKSAEPSPYGPPQPRPSGALGWIQDKIASFRSKRSRTAAGAYEQGRGDDDAWDSRVPGDSGYGNPGFYNENELEEGRGRTQGYTGAAGTSSYPGGSNSGGGLDTSYSGAGPQVNLPAPGDDEYDRRGRSRSRDGDSNPFGEGAVRQNPFGEGADPSNISARGVSPRPKTAKKDDDSPTDRRSMFRENM